MKPIERVASLAMGHSKVIILVMLLLTAAIGAGATQVEQDSSLEQFESDTEEAKAQSFIGENFDANPNATTVQIIVRNESGNVLTKASMERSLRYQQAIRDDDTVGPTLADEGSTIGVANIVVRTAIVQNRSAQLQARGAALEQRNQTLQEEQQQLREDFEELEQRNQTLQEDSRALQQRSDALNDTVENLTVGLVTLQELQKSYDDLNDSYEAGLVNDSEYAAFSAQIEAEMASTKANVTAELEPTNSAEFNASGDQLIGLQNEYHRLNESFEDGTISQEDYEENATRIQTAIQQTFANGTQGVLAEEFQQLEEDGADLRERGKQLEEDGQALQERRADLEERGQQLREDFEAFQEDFEAFRADPPDPTLDEQLEYLESMDEEDVRNVTTTVLSGDGPGGDRALQLMPTGYEPGSDTASARMLFVTQTQEGETVNAPQAQDERITDAQLQMQTLASDASDGGEFVVFGFGVINEEISQSQTDSMQIVGPLALLFVLITLLIAYRDLLDILLGVLGIGLVLLWTWGFMGWTGIAFNQIMIAVPVLLIGLSIDYAIHIFMRHREARADDNGAETPRSSMRVAQAGVGVALIWVTATTVIGFMSNLISPLGPIGDFGIASSAGILSTLLIFGLLIPALKVEIDGFFEARLGWDREKRAFGTGGGVFSSVLSLGSTAARKGPLAVILVALLLTGAGAAGATQVDTSFEQSDFLAEEPPEVLYDLPEPFKPGQYSAKENLDYVYNNFQSPNQQAQILINASDGSEGSVATADTLQRMDAAEQDLRTQDRYSDTVFIGASGEANVLSPLTVMRDVAERNESFNESFLNADENGDGVPDENVTALYDQLYEVAPDQATQVIYRNEAGEYTAVRMRISVKGTAGTSQVTEDMRHLASERFDDEEAGLTAVATGDPIINEIVQDQLLQTVIESLLITLVSVFVFLMIVYRITDGSASLGAVTLLPVALSVAWILGTMFLLNIPFNVVTGTITSLTIGLGVAYSIHLSERFNLEMDRQEDRVWPAMERSVTGTGGALLGSAATTAGGFGVLAFALLPALQQFGIITAITIVYAFLASVFVLPSLLAVWTRYLGPDDANFDADPDADVFDGGDSPDDDAPEDGHLVGDLGGETTTTGSQSEDPFAASDDAGDASEDPLASAPVASDASGSDAEGEADEREAGDAVGDDDADGEAVESGEEESEAAGSGAAGAAAIADDGSDDDGDPDTTEADGEDVSSAATPSSDEAVPNGVDAERSVAPSDPAPDEELTVSVVARDVTGRVVLTEDVPGRGGSVTSFDPEPLVRTRDGRTVFVVWNLDEETDVGVTYTTKVREDALGGEALSFEGTVETADDEAPIEGDVEVSVVTSFLSDLRERDAVTDADLEEAGRLAREDELTADAFQAVYREWLRGEPDESVPAETPPVGDGGTEDSVFEDGYADGGPD